MTAQGCERQASVSATVPHRCPLPHPTNGLGDFDNPRPKRAVPNIAWLGVPALLLTVSSCQQPTPDPPTGAFYEEIRRFPAPEARQAVAVDDAHFYAITNRRIGKYDKATGERMAVWEDERGGRFIHLNSGVILDGRLYAAHSNYPGVPMESSIEVFDAVALEHLASHDLGEMPGSATWIDRGDDRWWVSFANYAGRGGVEGRGPEATTLVAFDDDWNRGASFTFPPAIVARFGEMSASGGTFGDDGRLYVTGHDHPEVYVLEIPGTGSVLRHVRTIPVTAEGQGLAFDRSEPGILYTILRSSTEVVVSRLAESK